MDQFLVLLKLYLRSRPPGFGMLWSKRQDDFREFKHIAPAATISCLVQLRKAFAEIVLFLGQSKLSGTPP